MYAHQQADPLQRRLADQAAYIGTLAPEYEDYLFVVLHYPRNDKTIGRLNAAEIDVFIGPDFVITLPNMSLQPLDWLYERSRIDEQFREQLFSKGAGYLLYKIVDDCVDASFPMLRKMGNKLERIEEEIFEGEQSSEIVRDISNVKQEIINFRKIVRPQRSAFRDLERTKTRYIAEDLDIYFDDINDASERIWDMLENFKEVVEGLESTNESVLSHRTNDVLRVLTAFSVIILPLTLLASIFGTWSVRLRGEEDPMKALNRGYMMTTGVALAGFFFACFFLLRDEAAPGAYLWFFGCGVIGILASRIKDRFHRPGIERQLHGTAKTEWRQDGLRFMMRIPLAQAIRAGA